MKFRVERDALAEAVAWTARALPPRPAVPVLAGLLLETEGSSLTVSGFDYEVSTQVSTEVHASTAGRVLVSGRLLADITKSLPPHPVDVTAEGPKVTIVCGSARFTLPTMPVEDYPTLPSLPSAIGNIESEEFAHAVAQVAVAAGRDDTLPMLTGVRLEIDGDRITLAATDRYRLATRELPWKPEVEGLSQAVLIPAKTLEATAKTLTGGPQVTLALPSGGAGDGIIGFSGGAPRSAGAASRRTTTRLLDAEFPRYQSLWPKEFSGQAEMPVAPLVDAVKRVALMADRGTPVRLEFADGGVTLSAGGDDEGRAEEQLEVAFDSAPMVIAFNPTFLLDGLGALAAEVATLSFTTPIKPAVLTAKDSPVDYRYLIMPLRLPG
ncbi:MAG: DNA polymerase III subunit beta [Actinobacteria bacterium]|nr:DNA polymerase III subunit beta [Actinomycetota bacterium]MBI3687370.1 DNA polymerase III subunit beta [Actinomycetota bacterium]